MLAGELIEVVDRYVYLGSCISAEGLAGNEISLRIMKARAAFSKLQHPWHQRDLSLLVKGRKQCTLFCFTGLRPGQCELKMSEVSQQLNMGVSELLLEYGGNAE